MARCMFISLLILLQADVSLLQRAHVQYMLERASTFLHRKIREDCARRATRPFVFSRRFYAYAFLWACAFAETLTGILELPALRLTGSRSHRLSYGSNGSQVRFGK